MMKFLTTILFLFLFDFANAQVAGMPMLLNDMFSRFFFKVNINSSSSVTFVVNLNGVAGSTTEIGVVYGISKGLTTSSTLCDPYNSSFGTRVGTISIYPSNSWGTTINQTVSSTVMNTAQTSFYVAPYYARLYAVISGTYYYGPNIEFLPNWPTYSITGGKKWVQANLGALSVAASSTDQSSYGWYYNWGKPTDGHQFKNSSSSSTRFDGDTPTPGVYSGGNNIQDWQNTRNDNLWNGVNGINNPCPSGWRLPTKAEWVSFTGSISNTATAYSSNLKLPAQGGRDRSNTSDLSGGNTNNIYWSGDASNPTWTWAHYSGGLQNGATQPTYGAAVRCVEN
jgi:uncharacterized protein (TIGR02145 family)